MPGEERPQASGMSAGSRSVDRIVRILGFKKQVRQNGRVKYKHLSTEERYEIAAMRGQRFSMADIAQRLGRHRSTLYREVRRNRCVHDDGYRAVHSVWKASGRKKRSRRNLRFGMEAFAPIEEMVRQELSPEQIVGRCKRERKKVMSHETIYKWIWMDKKRGGTLWKHLRGAQKQRRKRYRSYDSRGRLAGKKMIESRPVVVERRSRIGDWEIDTVHGKGKACVVTVVERRSGIVRIGKLNRATKDETLARTIRILWADRDLIKTVTADNGCEFHNYKDLEKALGIDVYFATPHHAWERGSNENANGLIRQYFPKGTNLSGINQAYCEAVAHRLNNRPRKRLGFRTPNEVYNKGRNVALQS